EVELLRPFRDHPILTDQQSLVEVDVDGSTLFFNRTDTAIISTGKHDLIVAQHLGWNRPGLPPLHDVLADLVELLEGSVNINRIGLIDRHRVCREGLLQVTRILQRPWAGKSFDDPELGPIFRIIATESVRTVGDTR